MAGAAPVPDEVTAEPEMDVEAGSAKRPLEDVGDTTGQELQLRRLERKWKMVAGWKGVDGKQRSATAQDSDKRPE